MNSGRLFLPALRGYLGNWTYYSCLMPLVQLADRISFADEIHENKGLSDMIQRRLRGDWADRIANYLCTNEDRFFNSLVVAVYGGDPTWHEIDKIKFENEKTAELIDERTMYTPGFLSFSGNERLFAIDGQHRLAGIKKAISNNPKLADEEVSVLFVGHSKTEEGLRRTRKLFTTLNKTAKPVSKADIIALDESDAMAILTRQMVEKGSIFAGERVAFEPQANLKSGDRTHLTTIINLYDVSAVFLSRVIRAAPPKSLKGDRPHDEDIKKNHAEFTQYFKLIGREVPEFCAFLTAPEREFANVVGKNRTENGGHLLFRPVGQKIFVELVAEIRKSVRTIDEAVKAASKIPFELSSDPYVGVLWNKTQGSVNTKAQTHTRDTLLYMLGNFKGSVDALRTRRAEFLDKDPRTVRLPKRIA